MWIPIVALLALGASHPTALKHSIAAKHPVALKDSFDFSGEWRGEKSGNLVTFKPQVAGVEVTFSQVQPGGPATGTYLYKRQDEGPNYEGWTAKYNYVEKGVKWQIEKFAQSFTITNDVDWVESYQHVRGSNHDQIPGYPDYEVSYNYQNPMRKWYTEKTDNGCLYYDSYLSDDQEKTFHIDDVYTKWTGAACTPGQYINGFGALLHRNDNQHSTANHKKDIEITKRVGLMDHGAWQGSVHYYANTKSDADPANLHDFGVGENRGGCDFDTSGNAGMQNCTPRPKGELAPAVFTAPSIRKSS